MRWQRPNLCESGKHSKVKIHLVDGTYELFRHFYGPPPRKALDGREVGATVGLLHTLLTLLSDPDVTHLACAFDHVVESFRNDLFDGYKTGEGIHPDLFAQFPLAEEAVAALGVVVWPMVEFEADDALATAALQFKQDTRVDQIVICSPDKDFAQLVCQDRVVCWDRRNEIVYDESAVIRKFGVAPASIPDFLALVGDSADGFPGISGWGAKSAAAVLSKYRHLENIPVDLNSWGISVRSAGRLHENFFSFREEAFLYRHLARLRDDVPIGESLENLMWRGPRDDFMSFCSSVAAEDVIDRLVVELKRMQN